MASLFLSYRRDDSPDTVKLIHERLEQRLPRWEIFYDHDSIPLGEQFPERLRAKVTAAMAVLVIVGPKWLQILRERKSAPIDHVREEVRLALEARSSVVPVLVGRATLPTDADLADFADLQPLLKRNGRPVRPDPDFDGDLEPIIAHLKSLDTAEAVGTILDDKYTLTGQIGAGGMGVVYAARQKQPVKRTVAIKLIKPGMDSRDALARFDTERQALALMDHPNIAKVFDAGMADSGRPYFVMEHVKGVPITQYCDEKKLTPKERLNLLIPVCNAVQHAHQKGILHRDLKPSNVLVEVVDGKPVPKVIDFGLAKALGQKLTDKTLLTALETRVGTLEYSAPEQAAGRSFDVDTRSDIYSLGVLLYELLTGAPPFTHEELLKVGEEEMRRVIREVEPVTPSKKLSSSDELAAIAAKRHLEPNKLTRMVQGELDWIVMKCLEKENARRYETANQLGQELQRFLADEPVQAGPPSVGYRAKKFLRRNKGPVLAAGLVLFALIAGIIGTSIGLVEADKSLVEANKAKQEALEAVKAEKLATTKAINAAEAEKAATQEALAAVEAEKRATKSEARLADKQTKLNYDHSLALAYREWYSGNLGKWGTLLNGCPPKLRGWDWDFLKGLGQTELFSFHQEKPQWTVAFSKDGRWLAHAGDDKKITIRNAVTLEQVHLLLKTGQPVHTEEIRALAFSPDGKWLASASGDRTVKLWDIVQGKRMLTFDKHAAEINNVTFSPDGKSVASISKDNSVKVWDLDGTVRSEYPCSGGSTFAGLAFAPDGLYLACPSEEAHGLAVWNTLTKEKEFDFIGHTNRIMAIAFSPDGRYIASGSTDGSVKIWDTVIAQRLKKQSDILSKASLINNFSHDNFVSSVAFSPDGKWLASGCWDQTVKLWDVATGKDGKCFRGHSGMVLGVAFSADGAYLASAGYDGVIKIWETDQPQDRATILGGPNQLYGLAFEPTGKQLIGSGFDTVQIWDTATNRISGTLSRKGDWGSVTVSSDGRFVAAGEGYPGSRDKKTDAAVVVWDLPKRAQHKVLQGHTDWITSVAFRPDSHQLASAGKDGTVLIWDLAKDQPPMTLQHLDPIDQPGAKKRIFPVYGITYSSNGQYLASAASDKKVRIWDAQTGTRLRELEGHTQPVRCVAFSPDGRYVVSGAGDAINAGEMIVWDAQSWKMLHYFPSLPGSITSVAFHPLSKLVSATTGLTRLVLVFDAEIGEELFTLRGSAQPISAAAWDPTGQRLACANGSLMVWSADRSAEVFVLRGHSGRINAVATNPAGTRLVSVSSDTTVQIWDTATGQPAGLPLEARRRYHSATVAWSQDGKLLAYDDNKSVIKILAMPHKNVIQEIDCQDSIGFLTFSPDNTLLAVATNKPDIHLYDTATWKLRHVLKGHEDYATSLAFSPDGLWLASAGHDKSVRIWNPATGTVKHILDGHADSVQEVSFLDKRRLASSSKDKTVRIWDAPAGKTLFTLRGHLVPVWSVAYHAGEKKLLSVDEAGIGKVWDADTGKELATLRGHAGSIGFVHFNPEKQLLATAGRDGTVRLWDLKKLAGAPTQIGECERWLRWCVRKRLGKIMLEAPGKLAKSNPPDKVLVKSHQQVHTFMMVAGVTYSIDLESSEFDSYLRLEDSTGTQLAEDDDSGGNLNARIIHKASKDDTVRIIATSYKAGATGPYLLTVRETWRNGPVIVNEKGNDPRIEKK